VTEILTLKAAAEMCGLSIRTLRRAINADELRASELAAGRWIVQADDLHEWIEARANRPRDVSPVLVTAAAAAPRQRSRQPSRTGGLSAVLTDDMGKRAA
jgi:hypothetical protein